jgi:heat shock protein HtpX
MQMLKVVGLMTGLTVLMVGFGSYFGGTNVAILFLVIAAVMNFGMYWFSDRAVLKMYRARVLGAQDAPDLYQMVDRLRQAANVTSCSIARACKRHAHDLLRFI